LDDLLALSPAQRLALAACGVVIRFPVYGESMVRAALMGASDACYAAANILYRRGIASDVEPLATTQAGADREQAPPGLPPYYGHDTGLISKNGAWMRESV